MLRSLNLLSAVSIFCAVNPALPVPSCGAVLRRFLLLTELQDCSWRCSCTSWNCIVGHCSGHCNGMDCWPKNNQQPWNAIILGYVGSETCCKIVAASEIICYVDLWQECCAYSSHSIYYTVYVPTRTIYALPIWCVTSARECSSVWSYELAVLADVLHSNSASSYPIMLLNSW